MFLNIYLLIYYLFYFFIKILWLISFIFPFFYKQLEDILNFITLKRYTPSIVKFKNYISYKDLFKVYNLTYKYDFKNINNFLLKFYVFNKIIVFNNISLMKGYFYLSYYLLKEKSIKGEIRLLKNLTFPSLLYNYSQPKFINYILNKSNKNFKQKIKSNFFIKSKYINNLSSIYIINSFKNKINFAPINIDKLFSNFKSLNFFYIRNFKVFNKGRYSRNRQYYRTGVYWCLYVNIIAVVGMYYWFYRFTMNFGYLWWLFYMFILTFFWSKFLKYNFFINFKNELFLNIQWLGHFYINFFNLIYYLIYLFLEKLKNLFFFLNNFKITIKLIQNLFFNIYFFLFKIIKL